MRRISEEKIHNDVENMEAHFYALVQGSCFFPVFNKDGLECPLAKLRDDMQDCWGGIIVDESSRTHMMIRSLIEQVCSDEDALNNASLW